ncbi:MAG TPA: acetyl-CoA carboxylase biotin carboxyl carrier protein subunit, partial [Pseudonocardiaceae bacterium]
MEHTIGAPTAGTVAAVHVRPGDVVAVGEPLATLESMKMLHEVAAPATGTVRVVDVAVGATVAEGAPLLVLEVTGTAAAGVPAAAGNAAAPAAGPDEV